MSGIALFVPDQDMYNTAQSMLSEKETHHIYSLKTVQSDNAMLLAQQEIENGNTIIIARGREALEIQNNINVSVVNIIISAQELGLLVVKAKSLLNKPHITIGLFGWGDVFCNTTHFEELYDITLLKYDLSGTNEWRNSIIDAANNHVDIIIGERAILECSYQLDIPCLYLTCSQESLDIAIRAAESLYKATENEMYNSAQFSSVLDSTSNGVIKLSANGKILIMNHIMEKIIGQTSDTLIGQMINKCFPKINMSKIIEVLNGTIKNYSTILNYSNQELVIVVEPIVVDHEIGGAIMTFNRLRRQTSADKATQEKQFLYGHVAHATFDDIEETMKGLSPLVDRAKLFALSSSPMLIESLSGPELELMTQSIHNYSMRKNGPFITINLAGMDAAQQTSILFGNQKNREKGVILAADNGTLVIRSIDKLTLPLQYNFIRAIRSKRLEFNSSISEAKSFDTRIIACTSKNLYQLRNEYKFRTDLFFTLNSLHLKIPNLKDRPEDVSNLITTYVKQYTQQYGRYHVISPRAKELLLHYPWEGNAIQLQYFCERMILTAQSRTITEEYIQSLIDELYHPAEDLYNLPLREKAVHPLPTPSENVMRDLIVNTLKKHRGSRKLTAKELKMSTTTLWRRMKEYGLIASS